MAASRTGSCPLKRLLGFLVPGSKCSCKGGGVAQEVVELLFPTRRPAQVRSAAESPRLEHAGSVALLQRNREARVPRPEEGRRAARERERKRESEKEKE